MTSEAVRRFHFTVDVDWIPGSEPGLELLLELCEAYSLPSSLFLSGRCASDCRHLLATALRKGHEIGSHGWKHGQEAAEDFRLGTHAQQRAWMHRATEEIASVTGTRPVMFRAPNLAVSETTLRVLEELDYRLDSSVPARRFDFGYGQVNSVKYFGAPVSPYHPSHTHLGQQGASRILEVPPSASRFVPMNMTAIRTFGPRAVVSAARRLLSRSSTLVLYVHPAEFVRAEEQQLKRTEPSRYRKGLGYHNLAPLAEVVCGIVGMGWTPALLSSNICANSHCHHCG